MSDFDLGIFDKMECMDINGAAKLVLFYEKTDIQTPIGAGDFSILRESAVVRVISGERAFRMKGVFQSEKSAEDEVNRVLSQLNVLQRATALEGIVREVSMRPK
jgi:hypothetical protein